MADPALAPGAVEEVLRYDGPVHVTGRMATTDLEVADVDRREGPAGHLCCWPRPTATRRASPIPIASTSTRADNQHLTFSHGIHYCLGAALARVEGQEVFAALARRLPDLSLAQEPVHRDHFVLRGYRQVMVAPANPPGSGSGATTLGRHATVRHRSR